MSIDDGRFLEKIFWTLWGYLVRLFDLCRLPFYDGIYTFRVVVPFRAAGVRVGVRAGESQLRASMTSTTWSYPQAPELGQCIHVGVQVAVTRHDLDEAGKTRHHMYSRIG